jgi:hypothetical protein
MKIYRAICLLVDLPVLRKSVFALKETFLHILNFGVCYQAQESLAHIMVFSKETGIVD